MKRILRKYRRQKCSKTQNSPDLVIFNPRPVRKDEIIQQRANIEYFAVEIQQAILHQMPDFKALRALISASPSYLRAYQSQRISILSDVLVRDIHPDVLCDALAVVDALELPRNYDDYVPKLKIFIEQYKTLLEVGPEPLDSIAIERLSQFQQSVIDVTKDFCAYALSTHPVTGEYLNDYAPPSLSELRRIHRAFYRYELFARLFQEPDIYLEEQEKRHRDRNLFKTRLALQRNSIRSLDCQDKSFLFLVLFKPWEVEEIACVRDYITHRYDVPYRVCKSEVQAIMEEKSGSGVPPWENEPGLPLDGQSIVELEFGIGRTANVLLDYDDEPCIEHYLSLGLDFFHTFISASHEDQMNMLRKNSCFSYRSLSRTLEQDGPDWDNPMYDAWANGAPLGFDGDGDKNGPNAAWPWSTGNSVEIRYYESHKAGLRKWGYVMWDKERLDRWGILGENPRDHLVERNESI